MAIRSGNSKCLLRILWFWFYAPVCFCNAAELSSADSNGIDSIIEGKRLLEPWELKNDICCSKSAWTKVFNNGMGNRTEIQIDAIKEEISKEKHKNKQ